MKFSELRNLIRRRVRYRITVAGALYVFAVALIGASAFLSASNLLFLMFSAMLALLLVSGFVGRLVLSGLELELLLPEHVAARTPAAAKIRIRNLKRLTPSFSIELAGRPDAMRNVPSILRNPLYFPAIPGGGTIETAVEVTFPFRGRHRENLFALSTRFPFGFLRRSAIVPLRRETIVYPSLEPQDGDETLFERIAGEAAITERGAGLDFYRIRPYETTDSARLVDWKSTAHTGAMQVREFARDQQPIVEIFLDRRMNPGGQDRFERMLEQCAFIVWHLREHDVEIWFRTQRYSVAVPDENTVFAILRYLALAETLAPASVEEPAEPPIDGAHASVAFTEFAPEFERAGWITTDRS